MAVGLLVGGGVWLVSQSPVLGVVPLSMVGSIVGYESTVSRFQPTLALSSRGAMLGVGGTF